MFVELILTLGESDCETIGTGLLAQPVNAVTSLSYVLFGLIIAIGLRRGATNERSLRLLFALLLMATGVGSVMYHGTQGPGSGFVHDMSFLSAILFLAVFNLGGSFGTPRRRAMLAFVVIGIGAAGVLAVWPMSTNALMGLIVVAIVASDIRGHRTGDMRTRWWIGAVVAMALALILFSIGRTGGIACDEASVFQAHGWWHVLAAIALWAYFEATTGARSALVDES